MQFPLEKKLDRKNKMDSSHSLSTHHTSRWSTQFGVKNGVLNLSILQEIFSSVSKCLSCNGEKTEL